MKPTSEIQLTIEQEAIKINSEIVKNLSKKIEDIINRYKEHLIDVLKIELPSDSDDDNSSDEEQPTNQESDPVEQAILQDEIGKSLLSLYKQLTKDLTLQLNQPFKFEAAALLIQACLNNKIHNSFKNDVLNICHLQFYTVLIIKVDYLILQFRRYSTLHVYTNDNKEKIDSLNTNNTDKLLLSLRSTIKNGVNPTKQSFSFATLIELYKQFKQDKTPVDIKNTITEIYHIVINDILNFNEGLRAHFNYDQIDYENAAALLTTMVNEPQKHAIGPATWRICYGLTQKEGDVLVKKYPELINSLKKSNHFQNYDPFEQAPHIFFAHIIENPWMIAFFTQSHLLNFFMHASSDTNIQIIEIINTLNQSQAFQSYTNTVSDEAIQIGKSLFSIPKPDAKGNPIKLPLMSTLQDFFSKSAKQEKEKPVHFPMISAEQRNKKTVAKFLAMNGIYSKAIINETITLRSFILSTRLDGLLIELIPLLTPATIVDLFLEFDHYIPNKTYDLIEEKRKQGIEITLTAQIARGFMHYELLLNRIVSDIKQNLSIDEYCNKIKKIPYLLFELVSRETFLQLPLDNLSTIFATLAPELILETLQLLDPQDKLNQHIHLNKKVENNIITSDQYIVDKEMTQAILINFAKLLLSDNFKNIRQKWSADANALPLIIAYPFILKDIEFNVIERFIVNHKDKILSNAFTCLNNEINTFSYCPALLTFVSAEDIISLCKIYPAVRELFRDKKLPPEVIIHHITNKTFELLVKNIPELNNYLDYAFFEKVNKQLLNEQLLAAMIHPNSETTRIALREFPLMTNLFDQNAIAICANNSTFLRQILRQVLLLQIIEDNFDDLLNDQNIELLKVMVMVLYSNQASNDLLNKIRAEIVKIQRDSHDKEKDLKRQDPEQDMSIGKDDLIAMYNKKYDFNKVSTYLSERIFDEHESMDEIVNPSSRRKNYDPIVKIIENLIKRFPSRARQIIQSKGTYQALKEYCLKKLAEAADDKKRMNDHYPAILLYASLLIDEKKDYEEAAAYLEEYVDYLGLSNITAKSNPNIYDLLITCADGFLKMSCDEELQKADPEKVINYQNKALYYYYYIATALLAAKPVELLTKKLPLQCLAEDLTDRQKKQLTPAINILSAVRQQQIVIHFATKSIELMQIDQLEKQALLALISLVYGLLLNTNGADHYSSDIRKQTISLKNKLCLLAMNVFNKSYHDLINIFKSQQAIIDTHVVYKGTTKINLSVAKKIWQKLDADKAIEQGFFDNLTQLYCEIHHLIRSNTLLFDDKDPTQNKADINDLISLFNIDRVDYNQKHHYLLLSILDVIRMKFDIHDQLENKGKYAIGDKVEPEYKGIFSTIREHLQNVNDEQAKKIQRNNLIENTNTSILYEKKLFSPHSKVRISRDIEDTLYGLLIHRQKKEYLKGRQQISALLNKNKPINAQVPLIQSSTTDNMTAANKDDTKLNPIRPSFKSILKSERLARASVDREQIQNPKENNLTNLSSINTDTSVTVQQSAPSEVRQDPQQLPINTIIEQDQSLEDLEKQKADKKAKKLEKKEKKSKKGKHKIENSETTMQVTEGYQTNSQPDDINRLQQAEEARLKQQHEEELKKLEEERIRSQKEAAELAKQYQLTLQKEEEEKAARVQKEKAEVTKAQQVAIERTILREQQRKEQKTKMESELNLAHEEFTKAIEQARIKEQQLKASKDNKESVNTLTEEELVIANNLAREKEQRLKVLNDKKEHDSNLAKAAMRTRLKRSSSTSSLKPFSPEIDKKHTDIDTKLRDSIEGIKKTDQKIAELILEEQRLAKEEQQIAREQQQLRRLQIKIEERQLAEEEQRLAAELKQVEKEEREFQRRKRSTSLSNLKLSVPTIPTINQSPIDTNTSSSSSQTVITKTLKDRKSIFEEEARKRNEEKEAIALRAEKRAAARAQQTNNEQTPTLQPSSPLHDKSGKEIDNLRVAPGAANIVAKFSGIHTRSNDQTAAITAVAPDNNKDTRRIAQAGVTDRSASNNNNKPTL